MCFCICVFLVFPCVTVFVFQAYLHHFQASPAAHSPPLLTSRRLPANASAVRWQFAAPIINKIVCQNWGAPLNFGKTPKSWKKSFSRPKKVTMRPPKKSLFPNPYNQVLFAKKRIKIGQIWLWQVRFWSTSAYRGSPPCAIFHQRNIAQQCARLTPPHVLSSRKKWRMIKRAALIRDLESELSLCTSSNWLKGKITLVNLMWDMLG